MKYPAEVNAIYNKIKAQSSLTDDQLTALNVTKDKIDKAMQQCISKGMSRKVAAKTIYNLWKNADPDNKTE